MKIYKHFNPSQKKCGSQEQSLSVIVENYFKIISDKDHKTEIDISPNVLELSGIIKLPEEIDLHEEYGKHLFKKYFK